MLENIWHHCFIGNGVSRDKDSKHNIKHTKLQSVGCQKQVVDALKNFIGNFTQQILHSRSIVESLDP
jgi:hypothetical protein